MKTKTLCLLAIASASILAALAAYAPSSPDAAAVYGVAEVNEYGCVANCTAEYTIAHAIQLLRENPSLEGTKNVRIVAKVSKVAFGTQYFQDLDDMTDYVGYTSKQLTADVVGNNLMAFDGLEDGFVGYRYKAGDAIGVFGEIRFSKIGNRNYKTLTIVNPTIYKVGEKAHLELLPEPSYLN